MSKLISHRTLLRALLAAVLAASAGAAPTALAQDRGARAPARREAPAPDGVVNIQTATVDQLRLLPGIGPSKAEAIVAFRERRPFRRVEDLMRVRGIGRRTFRRLRPMLTIEGPTTLRAPAPRRAPAGDDG